MREKIVVMSEDLSNRIAAGEVIERPASIVKELVENALDAGATDILVQLEGGGKHSVKVVDNGRGIERDDVPLVFERHATSKIYTFEDIYEIDSFGFRGEAVASIASISGIEISTRRKGSLSGTRAVVRGGRIEEIADAGCPVGTSITVSDIFYSTPARMKFMKGDSTEQAHCMDAIMRLALSNPEVKIRVVSKGRAILAVPKAVNMSERIALVFGEDFGSHMLAVEGQKGDARLRGFISMPDRTRANTKGQFYFVNNRFIRDRLLNHSVITAYRRLIEPRRFPSVVLFIDIPAPDVDINVHPAKMEVRFKNAGEVYGLVTETLIKTLAGESVPASDSSGLSFGAPADSYKGRVQNTLKRYTVLSGPEKRIFGMNVSERGAGRIPCSSEWKGYERKTPDFFSERDVPQETMNFSSLEYLGQIAGTYLAFSSAEAFILMDQHAAHERVLFERLKASSKKSTPVQGLLLPEVVNLQPGRFDLLMHYTEMLREIGIGMEQYGENTILIKQIPAFLAGCNLETLISDILEEIRDTEKADNVDEIKDKIFTIMACKAAVKANHTLTDPEVAALCKDLDSIPFAATCPHGRPLYTVFGIRDLEKIFKRR